MTARCPWVTTIRRFGAFSKLFPRLLNTFPATLLTSHPNRQTKSRRQKSTNSIKINKNPSDGRHTPSKSHQSEAKYITIPHTNSKSPKLRGILRTGMTYKRFLRDALHFGHCSTTGNACARPVKVVRLGIQVAWAAQLRTKPAPLQLFPP